MLIADDHVGVRRMLRQLLEEGGDIVVCAEAADGEEAVRLAAETSPDVAVLDLVMPGMNGIEATQRIRERCAATEVLMVSLHLFEEAWRLAAKAGALGYLLKSEAPDHLVRAVRTLAREHRAYVVLT
ncbi:MAG TPA: response regulator transcription factor [Stellaceae bacterium]